MSALMQQLMQSNYHLLKDEICNNAMKAVKAEKIFIVAASFRHTRLLNLFNDQQPSRQQVSGLWLLVLANELGKSVHDTEAHIEEACKQLLHVMAIALKTDQFNEWLRTGHLFAYKVYTTGALLYDNGLTMLPPPKQPADNKKEMGKLVNEAIKRAGEFLAGAEFFLLRQQNKMTAFMLHQAAEQCLRTLLKITTGYHCNTHSIDKLARCLEMLYPCMSDILPQQTKDDKHLFQLLQKAYIDTRYKDDYTIHQNDLLSLTEKVNKLKELLQNVGKDLISYSGNEITSAS